MLRNPNLLLKKKMRRKHLSIATFLSPSCITYLANTCLTHSIKSTGKTSCMQRSSRYNLVDVCRLLNLTKPNRCLHMCCSTMAIEFLQHLGHNYFKLKKSMFFVLPCIHSNFNMLLYKNRILKSGAFASSMTWYLYCIASMWWRSGWHSVIQWIMRTGADLGVFIKKEKNQS